MDCVTNYVKTDNGKRIIFFKGDRDSFRCRQRSKSSEGFKYPPLRFVSFKTAQKEIKKNAKGERSLSILHNVKVVKF